MFIRKWLERGRRKAPQRRAKAATASFAVGPLSGRGKWGGERGGTTQYVGGNYKSFKGTNLTVVPIYVMSCIAEASRTSGNNYLKK